MRHLMVSTAERLQVVDADKEEFNPIATMLGTMVYNLSGVDATLA